jgi:hypothetical protein
VYAILRGRSSYCFCRKISAGRDGAEFSRTSFPSPATPFCKPRRKRFQRQCIGTFKLPAGHSKNQSALLALIHQFGGWPRLNPSRGYTRSCACLSFICWHVTVDSRVFDVSLPLQWSASPVTWTVNWLTRTVWRRSRAATSTLVVRRWTVSAARATSPVSFVCAIAESVRWQRRPE